MALKELGICPVTGQGGQWGVGWDMERALTRCRALRPDLKHSQVLPLSLQARQCLQSQRLRQGGDEFLPDTAG